MAVITQYMDSGFGRQTGDVIGGVQFIMIAQNQEVPQGWLKLGKRFRKRLDPVPFEIYQIARIADEIG